MVRTTGEGNRHWNRQDGALKADACRCGTSTYAAAQRAGAGPGLKGTERRAWGPPPEETRSVKEINTQCIKGRGFFLLHPHPGCRPSSSDPCLTGLVIAVLTREISELIDEKEAGAVSGARQNGLHKEKGLTWRKERRKQRVGNVGPEVGGPLVEEHKTSRLHRL